MIIVTLLDANHWQPPILGIDEYFEIYRKLLCQQENLMRTVTPNLELS